jgi:hypothetical protein
MSAFSPNSRPKLLGNLDDVTREVSVSALSDGITGVGFGTEIIIDTIVVNTTAPNSNIFLFVETVQNGIFSVNTTGRIRKDNLAGELLEGASDSATGGGMPIEIEGFDKNLSAGSHTYVLTAQRNVAQTTSWDTFPNSWNGLIIIIVDTHRTHESSILP